MKNLCKKQRRYELQNLCKKQRINQCIIEDGHDDEDEVEKHVAEIENCIDVLNDMQELIVVFDAIEHSGNLEDAIANAMLKAIKYRVENFEQFFRPETRSAELEWCLV